MEDRMGADMAQAKEMAKTGKQMGKKVMATDTAQDVVGVVVDGLEEVAVDKADDVAENLKARAARAGGRSPKRPSAKKPTSRRATAKKKPATKKSSARKSGAKKSSARKSGAKKSSARKSGAKKSSASAKRKSSAKKSTAKWTGA
jgi:hypothetical protein